MILHRLTQEARQRRVKWFRMSTPITWSFAHLNCTLCVPPVDQPTGCDRHWLWCRSADELTATRSGVFVRLNQNKIHERSWTTNRATVAWATADRTDCGPSNCWPYKLWTERPRTKRLWTERLWTKGLGGQSWLLGVQTVTSAHRCNDGMAHKSFTHPLSENHFYK